MWAEQATATPERRRGQRRLLRGFQWALSMVALYRLVTRNNDVKMMQHMAAYRANALEIRVLDSRFISGQIDQATYESEVRRLFDAIQHPSRR